MNRGVTQAKPVYVWQWPVRIFHLVNASAILVLMITGLYIGKPFIAASAFSATPSFVMGYVREIHFIAGYLFAANLLIRVYWAIIGNRYAQFRPWRKSFWTELYQTLRYYLFLDKKHSHHTGHNPLAEFSYLLFIGLGGFIMMLTGFYMMFEIRPDSLSFALFSWLSVFSENSIWMHYVHHWIAWAIMVFIVIHVYMAIRQDALDKDGTISSILTGYKTIQKNQDDEPGDRS